ncbi:MAG: carbon starvation protein A [Rikenellaceae bacterium]|nr:carbon starvation protein A [Rikenellaceae bacterium]
MITFIICFALLVVAYFVYGRYLERLVGAEAGKPVPSQTHFDGVDYMPLPKWKTFLIQLLNIAGLGPIFGAVLGALYGPVAFIWITAGGILFGAMHDFLGGWISLENDGQSLPEIIGKYLGSGVKQVMRLFTVCLMVLVGAVFLLGPAGLLAGMTPSISLQWWIAIILIYYVLATLLPVDKIIGRIYPLFGAALMFMALGLLGVLITGDYTIPELTSLHNFKADAEDFPIVPTLFITIACGAISGFHATQSPMMARCLTDQKQCRPVFFGAMISESLIALIWAAIAMAFFGGVEALGAALAEHGNNASWAVKLIADTTLGRVGGILAVLGVIAAPITSGDTAFRSARLIVADFLHIEQKSLVKRLAISIPLFVVGFIITLVDFDVVWRYFAWFNQTLAVFTLWAVTVYLIGRKKNYWVSLLPAIVMTFVCGTYLFLGKEMFHLDHTLSYVLGGVITLVTVIVFIIWKRRNDQTTA